MSEPLTDDERLAVNRERLRQWAERLSDGEATAIAVLGLNSKTGRVTVLAPEWVEVCDLIKVLLHATNLAAVQGTVN